MDINHLLANRVRGLKSNAIREILKVAARPGMISLAGGLPAAETLPIHQIEVLSRSVIDTFGARAIQYDMTEGFMPLREALSGYLAAKGIVASPEAILTASGSQGVLDAVGKVFVSPGDTVAVEAPTYLGALQALGPYRPTFLDIETDEDGLIPDALDRAAARRHLKILYLVPNFQNPTGRTLTIERRRSIARILKVRDLLLVEDDPYGDLRYRGTPIPPIHSLAPDHVLYVGTFSKIFAPGLRVGFCVAPPGIRPWLVRVKQGTDLHTGTFSQALAAVFLLHGHLTSHLPSLLSLYRSRQEAMLRALERCFPPGFKWSAPDGGMFVWASGPPGFDADTLYRKAIDRNVAFVPGRYFFSRPDQGNETLRLNFTGADGGGIERAVSTLGSLLERLPSGVCGHHTVAVS